MYRFESPLIKGTMLKRKSQFTAAVLIDGEEVTAHIPTTNRIGDVENKDLPCLLSYHDDPKRKLKYAIGGFIETVTSILGFIMMVTSTFGVIAKIIDGPIFVEMFLAGAAFEAIPILLVKLGEKGMLGLMDLLGRV